MMKCSIQKITFLLIALLQITYSSFSFEQDIRFLRGNYELKEVQDLPLESWQPYSEEIYKGFENGVYWFRIDFAPSEEPKILSIPESHITRAYLYHQNMEIEGLADKRYCAFRIINQDSGIYYLRVDCKLEARIPLLIEGEEEFNGRENNQFLIIGLYYGIVFSILFVNFFSFLSFRENTYLHYMLMVFGMAANAFYKDGTFALIFGRNGINEVIEPAINSLVPLSAILFLNSYLQARKYRPILFYSSSAIIIGAQILNVILIINGVDMILFTVTDIVLMVSINLFWVTGATLWKYSFEAKFFTIAYGLPLIFAHDFYLFPHLGIKFINLGVNWYKVGSIFEMIVFTYAIMYKTKRINYENKVMRQKVLEYTVELKNRKRELNEEATAMELIKTFGFTLKEIEILRDIALQKTNKQIAEEHFISINTVKTHIRNIFNKLEVNNKKDAGDRYKDYLRTEIG